jgi:uncharacterized linocin/CFP29 family protein
VDGDKWLEVHRAAIQQVITDETDQARLAHRLIPQVDVSSSTLTYPEDVFDYAAGQVPDAQRQLDVERFEQQVQITTQQTKEDSPDKALVTIRRQALLATQEHDRRVFRTEIADRIDGAAAGARPDLAFQPIVDIVPVAESVGEGVIAAVAAAISQLEDEGYRTGYAMVVSNWLWTELHRLGRGSSTLPIVAVRDLIKDGPVHQTSVLDDGDALLMSVGEGRIDRVVADNPQLEYVDQDRNTRSFDLFERFVPRFRETRSAVLLRFAPAPAAAAAKE